MKRKRKSSKLQNRLGFESLEARRCLASVGWDGVGQGSAELNYYVGEAPSTVDQGLFESVIRDALDVWSEVIDVEFVETQTPRQLDSLDITFTSIDGANGVLARAYFPDDVNPARIAGDVQFDVSENWELGNDQGFRAFDLMHVAVHEIGHALGLEHIDAPGSVLEDTVSPNQAFSELAPEDIAAAQLIYAPAVSSDPTVEDPIDDPVDDPVVDPVDDPTAEDPSTEDPADMDDEQEDERDRFRNRWRQRIAQFEFRRRVQIQRVWNFLSELRDRINQVDNETETTDSEQLELNEESETTDQTRTTFGFRVRPFRFIRF